MTKIKTTLNLLFLSILLTISHVSHAQITIGSEEIPVSGALLDLKNIPNASPGEATANKGLGMPRVALIDVKSLKPMYSYADAENTPSSNDLKEHEGLLVYNMPENVLCPVLPQGLYVWNSDAWVPLKNNLAPGVTVHKDQDGNEFMASGFGAAGVWMTENLRAKSYAGGATPPVNSIEKVEDANLTANKKFFSYPFLTGWWGGDPGSDGTDRTYFDQNPAIGLLYSWEAATNDESKAIAEALINQVQVAGAIPGSNEVEMVGPHGTAPKKYIQGICPNGWHLPSDREWNQLEKELALYPEKYSHNTGTIWKDEWETETDMSAIFDRGTHAVNMLTPCPTVESTDDPLDPEKAKSKFANEGGFATLIAGQGIVREKNESDASYMDFYGWIGYFWTSSAGTLHNGAYLPYRSMERSYGANQEWIGRYTDERRMQKSVRCKQND